MNLSKLAANVVIRSQTVFGEALARQWRENAVFFLEENWRRSKPLERGQLMSLPNEIWALILSFVDTSDAYRIWSIRPSFRYISTKSHRCEDSLARILKLPSLPFLWSNEKEKWNFYMQIRSLSSFIRDAVDKCISTDFLKSLTEGEHWMRITEIRLDNEEYLDSLVRVFCTDPPETRCRNLVTKSLHILWGFSGGEIEVETYERVKAKTELLLQAITREIEYLSFEIYYDGNSSFTEAVVDLEDVYQTFINWCGLLDRLKWLEVDFRQHSCDQEISKESFRNRPVPHIPSLERITFTSFWGCGQWKELIMSIITNNRHVITLDISAIHLHRFMALENFITDLPSLKTFFVCDCLDTISIKELNQLKLVKRQLNELHLKMSAVFGPLLKFLCNFPVLTSLHLTIKYAHIGSKRTFLQLPHLSTLKMEIKFEEEQEIHLDEELVIFYFSLLFLLPCRSLKSLTWTLDVMPNQLFVIHRTLLESDISCKIGFHGGLTDLPNSIVWKCFPCLGSIKTRKSLESDFRKYSRPYYMMASPDCLFPESDDEDLLAIDLASLETSVPEEPLPSKESPSFVLDKQLADLGFERKCMRGDGNCLWYSFCDQLNGNTEQHLEYRLAAVEYIKNHRSVFEPHMENDEIFDDHVKKLAQPHSFSGYTAIVAFAKIKNVTVVIHQPSLPPWLIRPSDEQNEVGREIHVAFINQDHYDSVRIVGDTSDTPSKIKLFVDKSVDKGSTGGIEATIQEKATDPFYDDDDNDAILAGIDMKAMIPPEKVDKELPGPVKYVKRKPPSSETTSSPPYIMEWPPVYPMKTKEKTYMQLFDKKTWKVLVDCLGIDLTDEKCVGNKYNINWLLQPFRPKRQQCIASTLCDAKVTLPFLVAIVVESLNNWSCHEDRSILLADPSGKISASLSLEVERVFGRHLVPGSAVALRNCKMMCFGGTSYLYLEEDCIVYISLLEEPEPEEGDDITVVAATPGPYPMKMVTDGVILTKFSDFSLDVVTSELIDLDGSLKNLRAANKAEKKKQEAEIMKKSSTSFAPQVSTKSCINKRRRYY